MASSADNKNPLIPAKAGTLEFAQLSPSAPDWMDPRLRGDERVGRAPQAAKCGVVFGSPASFGGPSRGSMSARTGRAGPIHSASATWSRF